MPDPAALEATVTSKGQITLPKLLRERLGLKRGSRIRFRVDARGRLQGEPILHDLEDLWAMADQARRQKRAMTGEQMDAAKARKRW
jgi:AbrB family looped-hinge helix DNA binding protein